MKMFTKKFLILSTAVVAFAFSKTNAQTVYREDFSAGIPATYTIVDVDGQAVAGNIAALFPTAWVAFTADGSVDTSALSTSWYATPGQSDDWLITDTIIIPDNGDDVLLSWDGEAIDPDFQDGYEVRISNTTKNVAGCLANPALFTIAHEEATVGGTKRSVDISAYAGDTVFIAFRNNSTDQFILSIDNIHVYQPAAVDAGLASIISPESGCGLSSAEAITVRIANSGIAALAGFPVSYSINGGAAVTENVAGPINVGDTLDYTFTQTADFSTAGAYDIVVIVDATGDTLFTDNNMAAISIESVLSNDLTTNISVGFEPADDLTGWAFEDANGDAVTWAIINTLSHSGTQCIRKAGSGAADDDWLYTPCLGLVTGQQYTVEFWYKQFDATTPCDLSVHMGAEQNGASMTTQISAINNPADDQYYFASLGFTAASNDVYHIGFHGTSAAGSAALRLDDIVIRKGAPTPVGIGRNTLNANVNLYPNPTSGEVTLEINSTIADYKVSVLDILGREVKSFETTSTTNKIDLTNASNGVYFVKIQSGDQFLTKKITLNK
jgi:hypothetical protein